jgi:hypothetical protein
MEHKFAHCDFTRVAQLRLLAGSRIGSDERALVVTCASPASNIRYHQSITFDISNEIPFHGALVLDRLPTMLHMLRERYEIGERMRGPLLSLLILSAKGGPNRKIAVYRGRRERAVDVFGGRRKRK